MGRKAFEYLTKATPEEAEEFLERWNPRTEGQPDYLEPPQRGKLTGPGETGRELTGMKKKMKGGKKMKMEEDDADSGSETDATPPSPLPLTPAQLPAARLAFYQPHAQS